MALLFTTIDTIILVLRHYHIDGVLESTVERTHMTQTLDPPSVTKKILITNKVTTNFPVTPFESICYTLHARSTADSGIIRQSNIQAIIRADNRWISY